MADRIVQLQDTDNNNVYPIAGGMSASSIINSMITDGTIKPAKLDWSEDWTSYLDEFTPISSDASSSISWTANVTKTTSGTFAFNLRKTGHVVSIMGKISYGAAFNSYTTLFTLPAAYRPPTDITISVGSTLFDVRSTGAVQCHTSLSSGGNTIFGHTWLTASSS